MALFILVNHLLWHMKVNTAIWAITPQIENLEITDGGLVRPMTSDIKGAEQFSIKKETSLYKWLKVWCTIKVVQVA